MLRSPVDLSPSFPSWLLTPSEPFVQKLRSTPLQCYTFGAPRVGSPEFVAALTEELSRDESVSAFYRIVNKEDIVARLPRSSRINRLVQYEHVGKTVLVDDLAEGEKIWVEGVSPGVCPLQDLSPFSATNKVQPSRGKDWVAFDGDNATVLERNVDQVASVLRHSLGDRVPARLLSNFNLTKVSAGHAVNTAQASRSTFLDRVFESIETADLRGVSGVDIDEIRTAVEAFIADIAGGVDESFIERELSIFRSIIDGRALDHHLEPSYFLALKKVVLTQSESDNSLTM